MSVTLTRNFYLPSDDEDLAIREGISLDADTFELSDTDFDQLKPKRPGRPRSANHKHRLTIRLSPDVVSAFRATGAGWQTRIDAALKDWLLSHPDIAP